MTYLKKSISAAQRKKDPKAGPHGSFPLDPEHLKAAWDLAGHAANPEAVRARVKAYAKAHGMMAHLPKDAQDEPGSARKARASDVRDLLHTAYHMSEPHSFAREQVVRQAARRGLTRHLPPEAHADLHQYGIRHDHPNMNDGILPTLHHENEGDIQDDPDDPAYPMMHEHVVTKAFNPKAVYGVIVKSWTEEGSDDQLIEGWMSTPDRDLEKDITEPEAFAGGPLAGYFARSAPLSLEHGTDALPAGHLQRAAIIRAGTIIEQAAHPTDPADFTHLPGDGAVSGVWVRARITEEPAKSAVRKGNVGGMSFIGNFTQYTPIPGGGKRYHKIDPLLESTVAAYPVNPKAAFSRVQKALGLDAQEIEMDDEFDFDAFMQEAAEKAAEKRRAEEAQVQKGVTQEQLGEMLSALMGKIETLVDERVQKAVPARGEGIGRKGVAPSSERTPDAELEADPVAYLIRKSQTDEELTTREKEVAGKLWNAALSQNMTYAPDEE